MVRQPKGLHCLPAPKNDSPAPVSWSSNTLKDPDHKRVSSQGTHVLDMFTVWVEISA